MAENKNLIYRLTDHAGYREALERRDRIAEAHRENLGRFEEEAARAERKARAARREALAARAEAELAGADAAGRQAAAEATRRAEEAEKAAEVARRQADRARERYEGLAVALGQAEARLTDEREAAFVEILPKVIGAHRAALQQLSKARDALVKAYEQERAAARAVEAMCEEVYLAREAAKGVPSHQRRSNLGSFVRRFVPDWAPGELTRLASGGNWHRWLNEITAMDAALTAVERKGA